MTAINTSFLNVSGAILSRLDDQMQHVQANAEWHSYDAADLRHDLVERDRDVGNLRGRGVRGFWHGADCAGPSGGGLGQAYSINGQSSGIRVAPLHRGAIRGRYTAAAIRASGAEDDRGTAEVVWGKSGHDLSVPEGNV